MAGAFDAEELQIEGEAVAVLDGLTRLWDNYSGTAHLSFSTNGSLAYVPVSVRAEYLAMLVNLVTV